MTSHLAAPTQPNYGPPPSRLGYAIAWSFALVACGGTVGIAGVDAGQKDAAATQVDAGTTSTDAGTGSKDGGTTSSDSGGTRLDAGPPVDAASGGGICEDGGITFELILPPDASACLGSSPSGCGPVEWLSIADPSGATIVIDTPYCGYDCTTCQLRGCPPVPCFQSFPVSVGPTRGWNGAFYATSTCGSAQTCQGETCAPAGKYVATMCSFPPGDDAGPGGACNPSPAPKPNCVAVPFDWPPAAAGTVVKGGP